MGNSTYMLRIEQKPPVPVGPGTHGDFRIRKMLQTLDAVCRQGRERLYPSLTNPSWLVLRRRRLIFQKWITRLEGRDLNVLDVGGRLQPYRQLLEGRIRRYVAIDLVLTPLVDMVASGGQIPLKGGQFDVVICTQMLEYAPEPRAVIEEIYRMLKPGGVLLLSVPAVGLRDADEDSWRFLPGALRLLVSPFSQSEIVAEGGSVLGFFRTINICMNVFVRFAVLRTVFQWTLCPILNLCGEFLDRVAPSKDGVFAPNYSVWARK